MSVPKIYLAGPDVFYPDPLDIAAKKKAILEKHGLEGVFPLDNDVEPAGFETPQDMAYAIARANEDLMRGCDAILANMTPHNGSEADSGTSYEVGFIRALGKPVACYTNDGRIFSDRVIAEQYCGQVEESADGITRSLINSILVESFDLPENLMLVGAARETTGIFEVGTLHPDFPEYYKDLTTFSRAAERLGEILLSPRGQTCANLKEESA